MPHRPSSSARRRAAYASLLPFVALTLPSLAAAADDHLACFKVKSSPAFEAATVDLASELPGFDLAGCVLKSKAAQVCVPVEKTVVSLAGGSPVDLGEIEEALHRVCYKLKCPVKFEGADLEVSDQFGTQTLTAVKLATLCTPALPGPPPTTSSTTTTLGCIDLDADSYGANCAAGEDCNDANRDVHPGATELCNSVDDDCDLATDESAAGTGVPCSTGLQGVCSAGNTACVSASLVCQQDQSASAELCNGLDDDCDGTADEDAEGVGIACSTGQAGVCEAGSTACVSSSLVCEENQSASPEQCNNLDDDCDGSSDEGVAQACYTGPAGTAGVGRCQTGTQTCAAGVFGSCDGELTPIGETCNSSDDDCDGSTDEGITQSCYTGPAGTAGVGRCQAGTQSCSAGSFGSCNGELTPIGETCNSTDDDCDGFTDEGVTQACYTGPAGTSGVGVCKSGTQTCSSGSFGACTGQVVPSSEICDNLDNDCDNQTDEGITRSCYTGPAGTAGVGACRAGTQTCSAGGYGACSGQVVPVTEICGNGVDDDCDGQTNEGC